MQHISGDQSLLKDKRLKALDKVSKKRWLVGYKCPKGEIDFAEDDWCPSEDSFWDKCKEHNRITRVVVVVRRE